MGSAARKKQGRSDGIGTGDVGEGDWKESTGAPSLVRRSKVGTAGASSGSIFSGGSTVLLGVTLAVRGNRWELKGMGGLSDVLEISMHLAADLFLPRCTLSSPFSRVSRRKYLDVFIIWREDETRVIETSILVSISRVLDTSPVFVRLLLCLIVF